MQGAEQCLRIKLPCIIQMFRKIYWLNASYWICFCIRSAAQGGVTARFVPWANPSPARGRVGQCHWTMEGRRNLTPRGPKVPSAAVGAVCLPWLLLLLLEQQHGVPVPGCCSKSVRGAGVLLAHLLLCCCLHSPPVGWGSLVLSNRKNTVKGKGRFDVHFRRCVSTLSLI